jgi:hypothetical protein
MSSEGDWFKGMCEIYKIKSMIYEFEEESNEISKGEKSN